MVYDNILEAVGHTPMIRLRHMAPEGAQVLVKFEGLNVGGSIKTRTALAMIEDAERRGLTGRTRSSSSRRAATRASAWRCAARSRATGCA